MTELIFAQWFGIVSVILSLGVLLNLEDAREMATRMVNSDSGYLMGGVLPVIFGSLSLLFIDSFKLGWSLAVTVVGCMMLAVGIYRVIFVKRWRLMLSRNIGKIPFLFSLFGLMIGIAMIYVGFFADTFDYVPQ